MNVKRLLSALATAWIGTFSLPAANAAAPPGEPTMTLLVSNLKGGSGSTVGPGGALYVTEGATGCVLRVDPTTGQVQVFASGLPLQIESVGIGGAMDVAFVGSTAYVLATLVGPDVGGSSTAGIYRVDGPGSLTLIADIGAYSLSHPPSTPFFVPTGVQYALQTYRGGLLATDGHHNRVLRITLDGEISEVIAFGNVVPTGLAVRGNTIYMAEAGPVPHVPETGKVVSFSANGTTTTELASGASLLVDVEFGRGNLLYALSQGPHAPGTPEGGPAAPNPGALLQVSADGTLSVLVSELDRPTSFELIGNTAYVVTLAGQIWKIDNVSSPPFGTAR